MINKLRSRLRKLYLRFYCCEVKNGFGMDSKFKLFTAHTSEISKNEEKLPEDVLKWYSLWYNRKAEKSNRKAIEKLRKAEKDDKTIFTRFCFD